MHNCLYCYQPLSDGQKDFHPACSKRIFGQATAPDLPYSEENLEELARQILQSQHAVTGVQAKISLHISDNRTINQPKKFTIVGLWGGYILKPPTVHYPQLPEVEDVTMHLAEIAKIKTAPHSLIRLQSGSLAYITKRMDRNKHGKLAMEDMCQLTERLTEDKYQGSYEQIAKMIQKYSPIPGLDLINFYEQVLFSFLTGNADMHLKNFSLLQSSGLGMCLSPAYDMVNTALVNPTDTEELALTLNGKKRRINRFDFVTAMDRASIDKKQQENIFTKFNQKFPAWLSFISQSFLSEEYKENYKKIVEDRIAKIQ